MISTASHLVIVNLPHALSTDVGATNYRDFDQWEWDHILDAFNGINSRFVISSNAEASNIIKLPLGKFYHLPNIIRSHINNFCQ